ncbi:hypothetical protein [Roseibium sp. RKSG952]|uniref:hypothetical protein n=1 Tax=Roseibium sp. RKSG952 TaxID=2529384 RepID=UPI0012BC362A|nr:hypothetical protein [Roseibium sp. RKSG952]MTI00177.1 hypothetical protein [Roseibium sp. RKSG952]
MLNARRILKSIFLTAACLAAPAAQAAGPAELAIELNKVEPAESGCKLSFVAVNGTGHALDKSSYELVFFDRDGVIARLTAIDFGKLAAGKTVVRQFNVPGVSCENTGRILVNGPSGCTGEVPSAHCSAPLALTSRTSVSFIH